MDKFIYETKFPKDVCDGIIDYYNNDETFQNSRKFMPFPICWDNIYQTLYDPS